MEFQDPSLSDRRNLYYSQTETATMNPTTVATRSSSSSSGSSSRISSTSTNEPLLTTGERIGAIIFASISAIIAIYFLLLNVRIRRYRKKKQSELPGRRRRPLAMAEQEDDRDANQGNLSPLACIEVSSQASSHKSDMAIAEPKDDLKRATPRSVSSDKDDDDDTEPDSCTYSLDEESNDPQKASNIRRTRSDSTRGDSTRGDSSKYTVNTRYTIDSSKYTAGDNRTEYTDADHRTEYTADESVRSYSLTTAFLDAILPKKRGKKPKTKNRRQSSGHDADVDSYYTRHEDDDDDDDGTSNADSASANTINSPFHPSPTRSRTNPPTLSPKKTRSSASSKQRTYFLSNDDSCLCADIGNAGEARPLDDGDDVFEGIPEEDEDRPFDCVVPTRRTKSSQSDKPFDCYGEVGAYHNLGNVM